MLNKKLILFGISGLILFVALVSISSFSLSSAPKMPTAHSEPLTKLDPTNEQLRHEKLMKLRDETNRLFENFKSLEQQGASEEKINEAKKLWEEVQAKFTAYKEELGLNHETSENHEGHDH